MSPFRAVTIGLAVLTGMAGCQHDKQPQPIQPIYPNQPYGYGYPAQPSGQPFIGTPNYPIQSGQPIQPIQSVPPAGGGDVLLPEPLPGAIPSQPQFNGSGLKKRSSQSAYPAPARLTVRLGEPRPLQGTNTEPVVRLLAPVERSSVNIAPPTPPVPVAAETPDALVEAESDLFSGSLFPLGIANYSVVYDSVACGLRPDLDGLDWLRENRYRTMLHVHSTQEVSIADQRLILRKGFGYQDVAVDLARFDPKCIEEFNRVVNDPKARPLFVYDRAGSLSGPLWYAHFRTVPQLTHVEAHERTARLGFNLDANEARLFVAAIRKHLGDSQ